MLKRADTSTVNTVNDFLPQPPTPPLPKSTPPLSNPEAATANT